MKAHEIPSLTVADYIKHELETETKYEYHNGETYVLAEGTLNHTLFCGNI